MAILTDSWIYDFVGIFISLIVIIVTWFQWSHTYWKRRGLFNPPTSFLFGNAKKLFLQQHAMSEFVTELYNNIKNAKQPHAGLYLLFDPNYCPTDPEIIKNIMQNDFDHFVDHGIYVNEETDPLSAHLFSLEGKAWRNLRTKLTPTFTSGKMKMMFDTLVKCSDQLTIEMDKTVGKKINIKDYLVRFTTDIIGSCAFGIDCNSLKNPDTEFIKYCKLAFEEDFWQNIRGFFTFIAPKLALKFGTLVFNPKLTKFFMGVVKDTVEYREKNNIYRKDFMHLLLQLKNRGKLVDDGKIVDHEQSKNDKDVHLTLNQLAAQAFVFFLAGFETSSTTMTFCLFELASNSDIQEKLRKEVDEVLAKHDNKITYDAIMEMEYMEKVINETLRKYPPLPSLNRVCTKEYKVPGTDVVIEEGTKVFIPVLGLHHDEQYYPNPEKFDPERFSKENKQKRHPYTYLPFGEGPRVCIGMRFGLMQTKVGLTVLLKNYRFSVSEKTQLPLKMDPKSFILVTEGGIWLNYEKV